MPIRSNPNVALTYNGTNITQYLDATSLKRVADALEVNNLASAAASTLATTVKCTIAIGGPWDKALDDVLGPDALSPPATLRSWQLVEGASGAQVTHAQTGTASVGAYVSEYQTDFKAGAAATWTGNLNISGTPTRT